MQLRTHEYSTMTSLSPTRDRLETIISDISSMLMHDVLIVHYDDRFVRHLASGERPGPFDQRKRRELNNVLPQIVSHAFKASLALERPVIPQYRSNDERASNESERERRGTG